MVYIGQIIACPISPLEVEYLGQIPAKPGHIWPPSAFPFKNFFEY